MVISAKDYWTIGQNNVFGHRDCSHRGTRCTQYERTTDTAEKAGCLGISWHYSVAFR